MRLGVSPRCLTDIPTLPLTETGLVEERNPENVEDMRFYHGLRLTACLMRWCAGICPHLGPGAWQRDWMSVSGVGASSSRTKLQVRLWPGCCPFMPLCIRGLIPTGPQSSHSRRHRQHHGDDRYIAEWFAGSRAPTDGHSDRCIL